MLKLTLPRVPRRGEPSLPELAWATDLRAGATLAMLSRRAVPEGRSRVVLAALRRCPGRASQRAWRGGARSLLHAARARDARGALRPHPAARRRPRRAWSSARRRTSSGCSPRSTRRVPRIFAGGPFSDRNALPRQRDAARASRRRPRERLPALRPAHAPAGAPLARRALRLGRGARARTSNDAAARPADRAARRLPRRAREGRRGGARDGRRTPSPRSPAPTRTTCSRMLDARRLRCPIRAAAAHLHRPPDPAHARGLLLGARSTAATADARGWRMIGLEGDNQPLGYSIFSRATGRLRRASRPSDVDAEPRRDRARRRRRPRPLTPTATHPDVHRRSPRRPRAAELLRWRRRTRPTTTSSATASLDAASTSASSAAAPAAARRRTS